MKVGIELLGNAVGHFAEMKDWIGTEDDTAVVRFCLRAGYSVLAARQEGLDLCYQDLNGKYHAIELERMK